MKLHLNSDDAWERFCSAENNSSATTALEVEYIHISRNPPLLEIALTKLSQIVKFSTQLSHIKLHGRWGALLYYVVWRVCEALLHSPVQQKIQIKFDSCFRMTYERFLLVTNLMKNCRREIGLCVKIGKRQEDGVSDLFADALRHLANAVTELELSDCGLSDDEPCALSENLMVNTTLVSLRLHYNKIGHKGAEALAGALKQNCVLTELDLSYNSMGKKGGVAIGNALLCNRTLEKLILGKNAICDEGAMALAAGLKGGSSLKELYVHNARIGKKGGVALGEALAFCLALETLNMNGNPIGDEGAIAIAGSLVRNTTLKKLNLGSIDIGDGGTFALAVAIACNATLKSLILYCNSGITERIGVTALINGLNRNSTLTEFFLDADHAGIEFALRRNKALLKELAWMKRFSDQDIRLKSKMLSKAVERYSMTEFSELTFLFLKSQVSTIAETNGLTHPPTRDE